MLRGYLDGSSSLVSPGRNGSVYAQQVIRTGIQERALDFSGGGETTVFTFSAPAPGKFRPKEREKPAKGVGAGFQREGAPRPPPPFGRSLTALTHKSRSGYATLGVPTHVTKADTPNPSCYAPRLLLLHLMRVDVFFSSYYPHFYRNSVKKKHYPIAGKAG